MSFPSGSVAFNQQSYRIATEFVGGDLRSTGRAATIAVLAGQGPNHAGLIATGVRWGADGTVPAPAGHLGSISLDMHVPSRDGLSEARAYFVLHAFQGEGTGGRSVSMAYRNSVLFGCGNDLGTVFDCELESQTFHNIELLCLDDYSGMLRVNGTVIATLPPPRLFPSVPPGRGSGFVYMCCEMDCDRNYTTRAIRLRAYVDPVIGWNATDNRYSHYAQDEFMTWTSLSTHHPITSWSRGVDSIIFNSSPFIIHGYEPPPPPPTARPEVTLVKSADRSTYDAVGQVITYSYRLTNAGNVRLTGPFQIEDDKTNPNPTIVGIPPAWLDPGEYVDFTATYKITAADLIAGSVVNEATGFAHHGVDTVVFDRDTATVTYDPPGTGPGPGPGPDEVRFESAHDGPTRVGIEKVYTIRYNHTFADAMFYNGVECDDWLFSR